MTVSWLRTLRPALRPAIAVVAFPHSGGSAQSFAPWSALLPDDVALLGVQYPGRADRFSEDVVGDLLTMSTAVAVELLHRPDRPLVLFGHSLGAVIAYETAVALHAAGAEPSRLLVSGSLPPHRIHRGRIHLSPDDQLWAEIERLGGMDPAVAANPELRELFLPILRSDIKADENYRPRLETPPLSCPVRVYLGEGDELVTAVDADRWSIITTGPFSTTHRPGGHFHTLVDVAGLVRDVLDASRPPRTP